MDENYRDYYEEDFDDIDINYEDDIDIDYEITQFMIKYIMKDL